MSLRAHIELTRGSLRLDVRLEAAAGETLALVGPNGAGKTTALQALAGLLRLERGEIALDGEILDGGPGGPFVAPEGRGVGVVFQDPLLFPRLTVLDNVAYGLRARSVPRADARGRAARWLERVGLPQLAGERPARLSGGQAQRVALARALAAEPRLLLLDEPLAAVDASAKLALRAELRARLREFEGVRIVVAHEIGDALALAERLVVLEAGRAVQTGPVRELVSRPASRYVADLVGLNCFRGRCHGGVAELEGGQLVVAGELEGPVVLTVHPRAVSLFRQRPDGSPRNVWEAPIEALEPSLDRVRIQLGGRLPIVAEVTHAAVAELGLREGEPMWVAVKATEIGVAPA